MTQLRLGVNVDHVATLRQARLGPFPDPLELARLAVKGGADGIVAHLREDRRHIQDEDVRRLRRSAGVPMDLEMAATLEIVRMAIGLRPAWCCLVPERRAELTTEGGLSLGSRRHQLERAIAKLHAAGILVSLFVNPRSADIRASRKLGADAVELHTGLYADARTQAARRAELESLGLAAALAQELGLIVNAGHGLDYDNVGSIVRIPGLHSLNIGFSIISRALSVGMERAVRDMKKEILSSTKTLCAAS
jgi:pyridoxine 5-phosphate synthase